MMNMYLLARNEAIDRWLEEHPAVTGSMFLVLGLVLLSVGARALMTGRSTTKHGKELEGPMAYVQGAVFAVGGAGLAIFSLTWFAAAMQ